MEEQTEQTTTAVPRAHPVTYQHRERRCGGSKRCHRGIPQHCSIERCCQFSVSLMRHRAKGFSIQTLIIKEAAKEADNATRMRCHPCKNGQLLVVARRSTSCTRYSEYD